jgi:hypothetical protein
MGKKTSGVSAGQHVPRYRGEYSRLGDFGLDSGHTSVPNGSDRREGISFEGFVDLYRTVGGLKRSDVHDNNIWVA